MGHAYLGAGCFWGIEAVYQQTAGVTNTEVGYMGGHLDDPDYHAVCTGTTGHAEVVHVEFDESRISYDEILEIFWKNHDPTTLNRQGPDIGTQYRSAIFVQDQEQKAKATESKKKLQESGKFINPVVTEVTTEDRFYKAEEYHQQYFQKQGRF